MKLGVWAKELRLPFLSLPAIFVPTILLSAWTDGFFHPLYALLTLIGIVSLHSSVNVLNDYFDYKNGIDLATTPTPFSGGSRVLPEKLLKPGSVLIAGLIFLAIGVTIGMYILYSLSFPITLVILLIFAVITVSAYSRNIASMGLGELFVGLGFGPMLAIGVYYVQAATIMPSSIIIGSIFGLFTAGILYVNQFPDTEADKAKGRLHLVARMGKEKASKYFKYLLVTPYLLIVAGVIFGFMPPLTLIAIITLPKARSAWRFLESNYNGIMELIPAMANTVMTTIYTGILLALAYLIWGFIFIPLIL